MGSSIIKEVLIYVVGGLLIFAYFHFEASGKAELNQKVTDLSGKISTLSSEKTQLKLDIETERKLSLVQIHGLQIAQQSALDALSERSLDYQSAQKDLKALSKEVEQLRLKNEIFKTWSNASHPADVNRLFNAAARGGSTTKTDNKDNKNNAATGHDLSL